MPGNFTLKPRGSGQPLPEPVQKKMESFFNTSFAEVRIHVGHEAAAIGALAFTHGTDLYFAPGQYNPQSTQGQQLLGHELTHVMQQRAGRVRNPLGAGVAVVQDPALEAEAERMGLRAASATPPIQAKPAGPGPVNASSRPTGLGPNAVAANGAILPGRSMTHASVQRKQGPILPGSPSARRSAGPVMSSPRQVPGRSVASSSGRASSVQCVLVDASGGRLADSEVQGLMARFPGQAQDIAAAHMSPTSYVVRTSRSGLMMNEQAPKSSGHFHYSIPEDYTTTQPVNMTNRQAATSAGIPLNLERKTLPMT